MYIYLKSFINFIIIFNNFNYIFNTNVAKIKNMHLITCLSKAHYIINMKDNIIGFSWPISQTY
jgi:hypothetical protein